MSEESEKRRAKDFYTKQRIAETRAYRNEKLRKRSGQKLEQHMMKDVSENAREKYKESSKTGKDAAEKSLRASPEARETRREARDRERERQRIEEIRRRYLKQGEYKPPEENKS